MGRKEDNIKKVTKLMTNLDYVRNIGTVAHIDHGKTTLSDSLLAGAGLMSFDLAGSQLALDYDEQEQARGITINAVNASMVHEFDGKEYLINLIDTPGHVDFGGDVTRAMRALDGAIVVVCAVEGVMPQTETVIRQAIKENVKPIIFINKVDRLINELKVTPEQMQQRFIKIITELDNKIQGLVAPEFKKDWKLDVAEGSIAFGSAYHKWATSVPYMKKKGISFKDIYDYCAKEDQKTLSKVAPVHEVILDMVIKFLPNPRVAQRYRIPKIWHGDDDSAIGKAMINVDKSGPVALMVNKILIDPHAGEVAVGRLFSGTVRRGQSVSIVGMPKTYNIQLVSVAVGADRMPVEEVVAGNMAAISGVRDAISGSTITDTDMEAFELIKHYSDPVVTVAIEAKNTADLPKLIDVLRSISKADPSIQVEINTETGEHLMAGMGELHLEITQYRIEKEQGVPITASEPIVVYRESVERPSPMSFEGKSPNKHNRFMFEVEPLEESVVKAIHEGDIPSGERIKDKKALAKDLQDLGMGKDESRSLVAIEGYNMLLDRTKGIQYLYETMELVKDAFKEVVDRGPLANEKVGGRQAARGQHPPGPCPGHSRCPQRHLRRHGAGGSHPPRAQAEAVHPSARHRHGRRRARDTAAPGRHREHGTGGREHRDLRQGPGGRDVRLRLRHQGRHRRSRPLVDGELGLRAGAQGAGAPGRPRHPPAQGIEGGALRRQLLCRLIGEPYNPDLALLAQK